MTPERWQQVEKLFQSAIERAGDERRAFLDEACAGDPELRQEVESLLAYRAKATDFLETPAFHVAAALPADEQPLPPLIGRRIGPYQVLREIGHGGMGAVYLAARADAAYQKQVAIKLVQRGMDTEALLRRFRNERQILACLDHPNIAKLLDGGTTEDGLSYFIMDYVEGLPMDAYCDAHKLPTDARLQLFRTVCSAVHYAHQNHVIHRDLKPSNILVTADGVPKLLDFGIAKVLSPDGSTPMTTATATPRAMTLEYASPEQVRGASVTPASDVYALGVLLYELLTGHRPYRLPSPTPPAIERAICEEAPEKPSTASVRIEEIPSTDGTPPITITPEAVSATRDGQPEKLRRRLIGDLDNIVLMALRKEPERRYASVEQFSEDIRRHLEGRPVIARQDTLGYRSAKFIKRNKASVIAAAFTLVALVVMTSVEFYRLAPRGPILGKAIDPAAANIGGSIRSLAVLPLENLSGDPAQEYFADGMTEALITDLARFGALQVISRTSVMQYKGARKPLPEIAQTLHVDAVVEGSVQRFGGRVQIAVQLIHAATDRHLWAERYERDLSDVLALQNEMARVIAREIKIQLTPQDQARLSRARPVHQEAYEAYLKGRHNFWDRYTKEGLETAVQYFEQAIKEDPSYAPAYAGLAYSYSLGWFINPAIPSRAVMPKAKAAALKALALDDQLAEAHTALALVRFRYEWDWAGAAREYQRALALSPNDAIADRQYAGYLAAVGRLDDAIATAQRARQLDPLSVSTNLGLGWILHVARQYDRAIAQFREVLRLDPNFATAHQYLATTFEDKGMYEEAIAHLAKADALRGESPEKAAALSAALRTAGIRGYWQKRLDLALEESKQRYVPANHIANLYARLGEKDQAFAWLEKAYAERPPDLAMLKVFPVWDGLDMRSDPRFTDLVRRIGLPP